MSCNMQSLEQSFQSVSIGGESRVHMGNVYNQAEPRKSQRTRSGLALITEARAPTHTAASLLNRSFST